MAIDISLLGKGGLERKKDLRDFRFELTPSATTPLPDFDLEPYLNDVENQNGSLSCVGQEVKGYAEGLNTIEIGQKVKLSARDIYSSVHLPGGGAFTVDAIKHWQNSGIELEADMPSYENGNPPSESFMLQRNDDSQEKRDRAMTYIAGKYTTWNNTNFETYRQAIKVGKGVLAIVYGNNTCWTTGYPETPASRSLCDWSHQILLINSKSVIINGMEYLKFRNSWGKGWGENGYGFLSRKYIESGLVVSPITVVDLPNTTYISMLSTLKNLLEKLVGLLKGKNKVIA